MKYTAVLLDGTRVAYAADSVFKAQAMHRGPAVHYWVSENTTIFNLVPVGRAAS